MKAKQLRAYYSGQQALKVKNEMYCMVMAVWKTAVFVFFMFHPDIPTIKNKRFSQTTAKHSAFLGGKAFTSVPNVSY